MNGGRGWGSGKGGRLGEQSNSYKQIGGLNFSHDAKGEMGLEDKLLLSFSDTEFNISRPVKSPSQDAL